MTALIYEIVWIRPLTVVFGTTIYTVSTIVDSFILGFAVGSWVAGRYTEITEPIKIFCFFSTRCRFLWNTSLANFWCTARNLSRIIPRNFSKPVCLHVIQILNFRSRYHSYWISSKHHCTSRCFSAL